MKKVLLGVFLVVSALSFSAERKVQVEVNFKDNEADGIFREYDETGKIINQETYKNGQLID